MHLFWKRPAAILVLTLYVYTSYSQKISSDVISSCGTELSAAGISLNWTIGENFTETLTYPQGIQSLGFHQTYLKIGNPDIPSRVLSIKVYPNPFYHNLQIETGTDLRETMVAIYTVTGVLVYEKTIRMAYTHTLDLSFLRDGTYILRLTSNSDENFLILKQTR